MELRQLVDNMVKDGVFLSIINNPLAQFGPRNRRYLGATLLPEETKPQNTYKETNIQYRTIVANAATRYSPPQPKGNAIVGSMTVELAESDIAADFTSQDYDTIMDLIMALPANVPLAKVPIQAMALMIRWADQMINAPLLEFNEKCRWEAIIAASVSLTGANGFSETVTYSDPANHRVAAGGTWSSNSYDPYADIIAGALKLQSKGYEVSRMITSTKVANILLANTNVQARMGIYSGLMKNVSGATVGLTLNPSLGKLNEVLAGDGLPQIEKYDLQYRTSTTTTRFVRDDVFIMCATTGRDVELDMGDVQPFMLPNTLGYVGIGRPANRATPGRAAVIEYNDGKGAPIMGQAWQTSLPVISNPEAIYVIGGTKGAIA